MEAHVDDHEVDPLSDRSHFRVPTQIPLTYEPVESSEHGALADQILSVIDPPTIDADPALVAWLDRIERKLDRVLDAVRGGDRPLLDSNDAKRVLLSGSGVSFDVDQAIPPGSLLLLSFELPGDRVRFVRCLGKVVHCSPRDEGQGSAVGVAFDTIRQCDVDAVVAHTVTVQRQQIRAAHGKDDAE